MKSLSKTSLLLFAACAAVNALLLLFPHQLPPPWSAPTALPLHILIAASAAVVAMMTFSTGWQTQSIERSWSITLLSSLLFGVALLTMGGVLAQPGIVPWITANTAQKAALFAYCLRLLIGVALLLAAATARFSAMPAKVHYSVLMLALMACIALYLLFDIYPDSLPLVTGDSSAATVMHAGLLIIFVISAAWFFRLQRSGLEWAPHIVLGSALLFLAETNFLFSGTLPQFSNVIANLLVLGGLMLIHHAVFQHSIRIPIDAMNAWSARLKTSQRELQITKMAVDASGYFIFMYDKTSTLLFISDSTCKRIGYTAEEMLGKTAAGLNMLRRDIDKINWDPLRHDGFMHYESIIATRSGEMIPVEITVTTIIEDDEQRFCVIAHDITERKRYELQREENAQHLRRIIDSFPHYVTVLDAQGKVFDLNKTLTRVYPLAPNAWRGAPYDKFMEPFLDRESCQALRAAVARAATGESTRCDVAAGDENTRAYIELSLAPIFNNDDKIENIIVTGVVITDRVLSQNQLKLAATVFDHSAEAILITDGNIRTLSINRAYTTITGFAEAESKGITPPLFEHGKHLDAMRAALANSGDWSGEVEWISKSGQLCFEWVTVTKVADNEGRTTNYIVIFSDITEKKRAEEHIQYLAYYDPLTNLPNRVLLEDRIHQAIAAAKRENHKIAIIFLDLDHFKTINDSLGHQHGDKILSEVAKRLKRNVREGDTVARLGGDEFIIVLPGLHEAAEAGVISRKLIEELALPYFSGDHELRITVSIGVSIFPDDGDDFSRLIMNADAAMYHAKESGRNNAQFFIDEMNRRAAELLTMENHLRRAIERNEFVLHYQPQINLRSGEIVGFEALVRWLDPARGMIPPAQFIPVAEERGLIADIGEWVLREACHQNHAWQRAGLPKLPVAVNISAKQFRNKEFVTNVRNILLESGLEPRYLELEVTETTVMQDAENLISTLQELQSLGVHLAVDDFGTGYSSLSYLKRFPIDKIKIDRSFIRDIPGDKDDHSIVRAIIGLTQQLNLKVIAEGVETIEQLNALRESHCDEYQGFYFSKPIPAIEAEQLLRNARAAS